MSALRSGIVWISFTSGFQGEVAKADRLVMKVLSKPAGPPDHFPPSLWCRWPSLLDQSGAADCGKDRGSLVLAEASNLDNPKCPGATSPGPPHPGVDSALAAVLASSRLCPVTKPTSRWSSRCLV